MKASYKLVLIIILFLISISASYGFCVSDDDCGDPTIWDCVSGNCVQTCMVSSCFSYQDCSGGTCTDLDCYPDVINGACPVNHD